MELEVELSKKINPALELLAFLPEIHNVDREGLRLMGLPNGSVESYLENSCDSINFSESLKLEDVVYCTMYSARDAFYVGGQGLPKSIELPILFNTKSFLKQMKKLEIEWRHLKQFSVGLEVAGVFSKKDLYEISTSVPYEKLGGYAKFVFQKPGKRLPGNIVASGGDEELEWLLCVDNKYTIYESPAEWQSDGASLKGNCLVRVHETEESHLARTGFYPAKKYEIATMFTEDLLSQPASEESQY